MAELSPRLSYEAALQRLGAALFPGEWIADITARELWLLESGGYFKQGLAVHPHAAQPGYEEAKHRYEFMEWQRDAAADWMAAHGLIAADDEEPQSVDAPAFEAAFARDFPPPGTALAPLSPPRRGGRPPTWDWEGAMIEIVQLANRPDGLPEKQADLERHLAEWFARRTGSHPVESEIRKRVARIYQAIREGRKPGER